MSSNVDQEIYEEADRRWHQYLMLSIAAILSFIIVFIPFVNFVCIIGMFVASIALMIFI